MNCYAQRCCQGVYFQWLGALLWLGWAAILSTVVAWADDGHAYLTQNQVTCRVVWHEGQPVFQPQRTVSLFAFEKLLVSEELAKELELSKSQQREIQTWAKSVENESMRLFLELAFGQIGHDEVVRIGDGIKESYQQQLSEILLPPQQQRLEQVVCRVAIRVHGFEHFWSTRIAQQKQLLSAGEKEAVRQFQHSFWEDNRSQIMQIQTSLNESILAPLDARQRELLDQRVSELQLEHQDLDVMIAQIQLALAASTEFGYTTQQRLNNMWRELPAFEVSADGQFQGKRFENNWPIMTLFLTDAPIPLTEEQSQAVNELRIQHRLFQAELMSGTRAMLENLDNLAERDISAKLKEENQRCEREIQRILTVQQLKHLQRYLHDQWLPSFGLFAALVEGDLGRELGLTERQIEKIREAGVRGVKYSQEKLLRIEQLFFEKLLTNLEPDTRLAFERAVGPPLIYVVPTIRSFRLENLPIQAGANRELAKSRHD